MVAMFVALLFLHSHQFGHTSFKDTKNQKEILRSEVELLNSSEFKTFPLHDCSTVMSWKSPECSWAFLLEESIENKKFEHACKLFERMQENKVWPDRYSFLALLKSCVGLQCIERGRVIHTEITKEGLEKDLFVGGTLVDMYMKFGALGEAREVFNKLEAHDVVSWTALIAGYAENGFDEETLHCLRRMQSDMVLPNATTYLCSLKSCSNSGGSEKGYKLHIEIVKDGYETHLFVGSTLVDMYAKCGLLAEAQEVFDELPVRNTVTWNALIMGYAKHQFGEKVLNRFTQMETEGVPPDAATYVCSLKGCGSIQALNTGRRLYGEITKKGLDVGYKVSSIVVDMFAKCGSLLEASEVFDKLPMHDTILWNSFLASFVGNGLGEKALDHLKQMDSKGVLADLDTLVISLKACGSIRSLKDGQELYTRAVKDGHDQETSVSNILIDMYLKCGSLIDAQKVFDDLPVQDAISWTTLITGYTELGLGERALTCLEKMELQHIVLDVVALLCCLKACSITSNLSKAQELHADIVEEGYEDDLFLANTLVDIYAKCGFLVEAQGVLEELPVQDVGSWNALISGCTELGHYEEALEVFRRMQSPPNLVTYVCSLKCCGMIGDSGRGQEIHAEAVKKGIENDPFVASTLIDMYSKLDLLSEAECVLDKLRIHEIVPWNAMITGYAEHGLGKEALMCIENMYLEGVSPDAVTLMSGLKGCGSIGDLDKVRELHADIARKGFVNDPHVDSSLVDMYVKCDSLVEACKVFSSMPVHDVVSWTALITGHAEHGLVEEALLCLKKMSVEGVYPNDVTYISSLKACSSIRDRNRGHEIHKEIAIEGFERDPFVSATLVDMYAKCGALEEAHDLLIDLQVLDAISWTALIAGYAEHGLVTESLSCLEQMEQAGLCANFVTYICSLKASGSAAAVVKGQELHSMIVKKGLESDPLIGSSLTDMYAKSGFLQEALRVSEQLPSQDVVSWNILLTGYACQGESHQVFLLHDRMQKAGIGPDRSTFLIVLFVCSHAGLVDEGHKLMEVARAVHGVTLMVEHYNCMIDLLTRAGQFFEAWKIMEKMPFQPELVTWSTMLCACQKWDNGEVARQAFDYAVMLGRKQVADFQQRYNLSYMEGS